MSVVMATFMVSMIPRAAVAAERIQSRCSTPSRRVRPARRPGHRASPSTARSSSATSASTTRAPSTRCSSDISFRRRAGQTTAIIGSTGAGKTTLVNLVPRLFDATDGRGARRRRRRARPRPRPAVEHDRLRAAEGRTCSPARCACNLRFGEPDATDDELWEALEIAQAADFVRAMPDGLDSAIDAGRHQRVGRPAPAAVDRPGARAPTRDLRVRRLVLGARPRHRRPPARRAGAVHRATPPCVIVAQRVSTIADADQILVLEDGEIVGARHARRAARRLPDLRRDRRSPSSARGARHERRQRQPRTRRARRTTTRSSPRTGHAAPTRRVRARRRRRHARRAQRRTSAPRCAGSARSSAPRRRASSCVLALTVASVALVVLGPRLLGHATDIIVSGVASGDGHRLRRAPPQAAPRRRRSTLASWALAYVAGVHPRRRRAAARCSGCAQSVEDKINRLPLSYIDRQPRGDLLSRVTNDIDNLAQSLQQTLSQILTSLLTLIGVTIMMFTISPLLAVVALITVPLSVWMMKVHRRAGPARASSRSGATPAALNAPDRGDVHRPRDREELRPPARGRGRASATTTTSSTRPSSAPSSCRA